MISALTIAGSDSSGGAGVQADCRAFAAAGVHGVCAVTAVTAQTCTKVERVHVVPPDVVAAQIRSAGAVERLVAAKTGMLADRDIVAAATAGLQALGVPIIVVDPVLTASSGTALLTEDAVETVVEKLLPIASCITPNRGEAERLADYAICSLADVRTAARRVAAQGPSTVIVTGSHLTTDGVIDIVFDGTAFHELRGPRIPAIDTHGTGCAFSAALTAGLAQGLSLVDAARRAKQYVIHDLSSRRQRLPSGPTGPVQPRANGPESG